MLSKIQMYSGRSSRSGQHFLELHGGNGLVMRDNFCISKEMQRLSLTSEKKYCFFAIAITNHICVMIEPCVSVYMD